jgi:hypothetical protein
MQQQIVTVLDDVDETERGFGDVARLGNNVIPAECGELLIMLLLLLFIPIDICELDDPGPSSATT